MKSKLVACSVLVGVLFMAAGAASATPAHYTDGTAFNGPINYGPPPLAPTFSTACAQAVVDPPSFTFITLHFVYGTTVPPATVPVHDDAAEVVNYVRSTPGTFVADVSSFVAGKTGFLATTWNIGTGVTAWVPFDCTSQVSPTTVVVAGSTIARSPATTSPFTDTGAVATSTSSTNVAPASTSHGQLPFTGGDIAPLAFAAVLMIATGALITTRRSRVRR